MESLEQLSGNNLEAMDVEKDPITSSVMNIDRNKIECIPKTNQVPINIYIEIKYILRIICKCIHNIYFIAYRITRCNGLNCV